jgi:hypothetical protein
MARFSRTTKERTRRLLAQHGDPRLVAKIAGMPRAETIQKWAEEEGWTVYIDGSITLKSGAPRRFETAGQLESELEAYFLSLMEPMMHVVAGHDEDGKATMVIEPMKLPDGTIAKKMTKAPTIPGMCLYMGVSRITMKRYQSGEYDDPTNEYMDVLDKALMIIEEFNMQKVYDPDSREGAKFVLERVFKYYPKTIVETNEVERRLEDYFIE